MSKRKTGKKAAGKKPAKRKVAKKRPVKRKAVKKKAAKRPPAAKPREPSAPRPEPLIPRGMGGLLIVLSGPSGAGKSTVAKRLALADSRIWRSVSMTTRPPREGELNGIDYFFVPPASFARERATGGLLESATVHGESYGTPRRPVVERLLQNRDVLLEIDVQGAMQVKRTVGGAVFLFVRPPSRAVLEQRLRDRGSESEESILSRLATADKEIAFAGEYDYLVMNDDLDRAVPEVLSVIVAERNRSQRRQDLPW